MTRTWVAVLRLECSTGQSVGGLSLSSCLDPLVLEHEKFQLQRCCSSRSAEWRILRGKPFHQGSGFMKIDLFEPIIQAFLQTKRVPEAGGNFFLQATLGHINPC